MALPASFKSWPWEDQDEYDTLFVNLHGEHKPSTLTESVLVEKMAQSLWLTKRALLLQHHTFNPNVPECDDPKQLALYLRYQTTHDRAFHRCLNQLLKLRAEKRKAEIGFESQERKRKEDAQKQADQTRREAAENRKHELHRYNVLLAEAKADHQDFAEYEPPALHGSGFQQRNPPGRGPSSRINPTQYHTSFSSAAHPCAHLSILYCDSIA
jgi:hypothetical protein